MAVATVQDVSDRSATTYSAAQETQIEVLLEDAESLLIRRIPDLLEKVEDDPAFERRVIQVEVAAVLRVIRNASGIRSESSGDFSITFDRSAASGYLSILGHEWSSLISNSGVFSYWPLPPYGV